MAYVINTAINDTFVLRDGSNVALTGKVSADFATIEAYLVGTPATTAAVTLTDIGAGEYRVSFTPTTAGVWTGHLVYDSGGVFREFSETYDVLTAETTVTVIAASGTGSLTMTRAELRRRVAERLGDYTPLTATAVGLSTTIVDIQNINTGTEDMKGRVVMATNGTNNGLVRRITGQVDATGTLTVAAFTAATAANDTFEVYNKRGKGFIPNEYHRAINNAINDAFPLGLIEITDDIAPVFDATTPEITVPASFVYVTTVEWADDDGFKSVLPKATRTNQYGWIADGASGELRLLGMPADIADGFTLHLTGFGRQAELSAEADTCSLNAEYIVSRACYHLAMGALDKDAMYGQMVGIYLQESTRLRTRVRTLNRGEMVRSA